MLTFYALVFAISWGGIVVLVGPGRIPGTTEEVDRLFLLALVAQFAGPSIAGIVMTGLVSGRAGLRELLFRLLRWRVGARWYAAALLAGPLLVAAVLFGLSRISPVFVPGIVTTDDRVALLLFGLGWGLVGGGLLEELGWTGFAVPRLRQRHGAFATGLLVGLLWGAWHFLIAFWSSSALAGELSVAVFVAGFLAFYIVALPAYRVLMVWVYDRTASLPVAMLMHALLSASTLILQPRTTAGHLTWNVVLAAALWAIVAAVALVHRTHSANASESRIPVGPTSLYARSIGRGQPIIVLHGGPDFDHRYLLPDLDQWKDQFRLIYYDQRGRGSSAENVQPEDVSLTSELDDLDKVRQYFRLDAPVLLGHSWGALLALEYAVRYPTRVSHLILMNPAPVSVDDAAVLRRTYLEKLGDDMDRQREIVASSAYQAGDPDAVSARYRIHFKPALKRADDYDKLMARMTAAFIRQGKDDILKARAIEDRLYRDTWKMPGYDLMPKLRSLRIPTMVIAGDQDFIPVEIAEHITHAIPNAKLIRIRDCGHFAFLERADEVRRALNSFLAHPENRK